MWTNSEKNVTGDRDGHAALFETKKTNCPLPHEALVNKSIPIRIWQTPNTACYSSKFEWKHFSMQNGKRNEIKLIVPVLVGTAVWCAKK